MYKYEKIHTDKNLPIKMYNFYIEKETNHAIKHWHNSLEIVISINGLLNVHINNQELILKEGEILIINSKDVHQLNWIDETEIHKGYCIQINDDYVKKCCHFDGEIRFKQPTDLQTIQLMKKTIFRIANGCESSSNYVSLLIESEILMLMYILCNNLIEDNPDSVKKDITHLKGDKYKKRITNMVNYLEEHYNENLSIELVAEHFNMSGRYFSKLFKDNLGVSPKKYLTLYRLQKVADLLEDTDDSITDIAFTNGFTSLSSFYSFFNKVYGKTPVQYREEKSANSNK